MRGELTGGKLTAALAVWAVAFGAVAWLLLGPVWAIAGVLVGPLVGLIGLAVVRVYATTDAAALLRNDQPDEAIAQLRREMASWRARKRLRGVGGVIDGKSRRQAAREGAGSRTWLLTTCPVSGWPASSTLP